MAKKQANITPTAQPKKKETTSVVATAENNFFLFLKDNSQRIDWAIILGLNILILFFLKIYYPYPATETDSGNYIVSAVTGKINGVRPFGYSAFMSFFHGISSNVKFVVTWQWLLTFIASTWFLFTIKYIFKLSKLVFIISACLLILNPSILYLNAYMMSDSLFISLTLFYLTAGLWVAFTGNLVMLALHFWFMYLCIHTRYVGMFYPIISALFIFTSMQNKWLKIGLSIVPFLILLFYRSAVTEQMKEEFGTETFSAFGGWVNTNNAAIILPFTKVDTSLIKDNDVRYVHSIIKTYPDSCFKEAEVMATSLMWTKSFPEKGVLFNYIQQTGSGYMPAWVKVGTLLDKYGDFLKSNYPMEYIKHFLIPNAKNVFKVYDILELKDFAADANLKTFYDSDVEKYTFSRQWFKPLTSIRMVCEYVLWFAFLVAFCMGILLFKNKQLDKKSVFILSALFLFIGAFCAISIYAHPINNFRYMMPILYPQFIIVAVVLDKFFFTKKEHI